MNKSTWTCGSAARRRGLTLIELSVSVAIMGLLFAVVVPAVQNARETARRVHCRNNLRQIGVAAQGFEATYRRFPGNGWGWQWVGDPARGVDQSQPGGWIFQLLPQLGEAKLWASIDAEDATAKNDQLVALCATPLSVMKCPSRPAKQVAVVSSVVPFRNADGVTRIARTDYAVCEGDFITNTPAGPTSFAEVETGGYLWTDVSEATGVSWMRGSARIQDIRDGTSNTYFAGEKYVARNSYTNGNDLGYDQTMYCGVDLDINRWTLDTPIRDQRLFSDRSFGSAHPSACLMVMCDGSVVDVSYLVDADVHRNRGNRSDGNFEGN